MNPDRILEAAGHVVASSDHAILDRCPEWFNLAWQVITGQVPQAYIVDLGSEPNLPMSDRCRQGE